MATNEDEACEALMHLTRRWHLPLIPTLISILGRTQSKWVRNAVAIGLSDLRAQEALHVLVKEAKNPTFRGYSGTLVSALWTLDCRSILHELADFIVSGESQEVVTKAFHAIANAGEPVPYDSKKRAMRLLRRAQSRAGLEPFRSEFISDSLEILDGLKAKRS